MRVHNAFFTLTLAVVLITLVGLWRASVPSTDSGMPQEQFWAVKYSHCNDSDIVLAGCSRVYRGLTPETIKDVIPGVRVTNFGFSGLGYEPKYFDAIDRVLDENSKCKVIVLGIAPHNFQNSNVRSNGFLDLEKQNAISIWLVKKFGYVAYFTRSFTGSPNEAKNMLTSRKVLKSGYFQVFHKDGWVESEKIPENPMALVKQFKEGARAESANPKLINSLLEQVQKWHSRGIKVYGLRIPTSAAMRNVENEYSQFNESGFIDDFSKAGGIWIPVEIDGYISYDGSHLRADSAVKLSKVVGEFIEHRLSVEVGKRSADSIADAENASRLLTD